MKTIIIASTNKKKKEEIKHILKGLDVKVMTVDETGHKVPKVIENGATFEANAEKKARVFSRKFNACVIADDSGLMVDVLGGRPGVKSARFSGTGATDATNNELLLKLLKDKPISKRKARFVCVIAVASNGKIIKTVRGECRGRIGFLPKGDNGFGYDPLFIPEGYKKTFAELSAVKKNNISHRKKALLKTVKIVRRLGVLSAISMARCN